MATRSYQKNIIYNYFLIKRYIIAQKFFLKKNNTAITKSSQLSLLFIIANQLLILFPSNGLIGEERVDDVIELS